MRDTISIERAANLHPAVRQEVIDTITEIEKTSFPESVKIRIVQGLRTIEYQNELYAQGRTKPGNIVTKAKGGSSFHNYGLAIDFAIMYDDKNISWDIEADKDHDGVKDWSEIVNAFKAKGWAWGGDWHSLKDYPHLEKSFGNTWRVLLEKYNKKDFIPGTQYINL